MQIISSRLLFIDSIRTLDLVQIEQILTKEIADIVKGIAPILKVIEIINLRETNLKEINEITKS